MSIAHALAIRGRPHPRAVGLSENPYPGSDGATTWEASSGPPPWAVGSVSGAMTLRDSTTEPGHPCVRMVGSALRCFDGTCREGMPRPSISVRYLGTEFNRR